MYPIVHYISYLIRTRYGIIPTFQFMDLHPILSTLIVSEVILYASTYLNVKLYYSGGCPVCGSILYLVFYFVTIALISVVPGFTGIDQIYVLIFVLVGFFSFNFYVSNRIRN